MKIMKFYAVKIKNNTELERVEIGTARVDPDNVIISAGKYDALKRNSFKHFNRLGGNECVKLCCGGDKWSDFGGYPATGFIRNVKFE